MSCPFLFRALTRPLLTLPLLLANALACGETAKASADALASEVAGDAASAGDADAVTDASGAEVAEARAAGPGPAESECLALAKKTCAAVAGCCGKAAGPGCVDTELAACLKAGFGAIEDAAVAGAAVQDVARHKACLADLDAAFAACDRGAAQRARNRCLLAWTDLAVVGETCGAQTTIACAGGSGRCDPKSPPDHVCVKAGDQGDSCKLTAPCHIDLACRNTELTRATVCGKAGSTCHLSDKCPEGKACDNGTCVHPGAPPSGQACGSGPTPCGVLGYCATDDKCATRKEKGTACSGDQCAPGLECLGGTCKPKLCALAN